ncbi:unnamed protein product [Mytilus coruscus]|uniref:C-type lectin domain-containing protein n=1 Tax=Mytilus coruscus TaxID=42192 RepID=A0A6J8BM04_MYTCO|nr:unnamed protein product [Mytilus coruscus]
MENANKTAIENQSQSKEQKEPTGEFTCTRSDWILDGSKCYKTISGSPSDGQARCSNEDPNAILMLAPSSTMATVVGTLFSGEKIWVGLRFREGAEWFWDDGSNGPVTWGSTPILPQLCIGVFDTGLMYDYDCYKLDGLICQKDLDVSGSCESGWTNFGNHCFKRLRLKSSGVNFSNGRILCSNENAFVMMPRSQSEASEIATNLALRNLEPNKRDLDYICAYIQNGQFYNGECTALERVLCKIDALSTTMFASKEPISSVKSETKVTPEHLSTALKVSSHISSVFSKTSTKHPQIPTQTTKYKDDDTTQTTYKQTSSIKPTIISSQIGKSNCLQSTTNSCHCQKRTVANTTENKDIKTLKVSDFIWLKKCALQPMIDSGMFNVFNCPYICKCSPKGSTKFQEDMFACVRRP